ncbi:MAG: hypothetical protein ACK550_06370 [Synechococcaceae cyanobacterium]
MAQPTPRWLPDPNVPAWGTTAASRQGLAPHPEVVTLDGRAEAEQIRFVQELAKQIGWEAFCCHPELSAEAMAAQMTGMEEPGIRSAAQKAWLGRPHFALLLVFIRLLRHQRQLLNALPARHLDHYVRGRLGFAPRLGEPDRVTVAFTLVEGAPPIVLPAGSLLRAGEDNAGEERLYRTVSELSLNHIRVRRLRSIQLERGLTSLATIAAEEPDRQRRLERMLNLVYGQKAPAIADIQALESWLGFWAIDGKPEHPQLEPREFLQLMRLVRQRSDAGADQEWAAINRWLGVQELLNSGQLPDPRDFATNFSASLLGVGGGLLDPRRDGIGEINNLDDLYLERENNTVKNYLKRLFTAPSCLLQPQAPWQASRDPIEDLFQARLATFVRLMTLKLHIDAQWQQVNWLLERLGRRRRRLLSWRLDPHLPNSASAAFSANLALALALDGKDANAFPWPKPLDGVANSVPPRAVPGGCWRAYTDLVALERRYHLPLEQLLRLSQLVAVASRGTPVKTGAENTPQPEPDPWPAIREILQTAHAELWAAGRRQALERARQGLEGVAAFAQTLRQALPLAEEEGQGGDPAKSGNGALPWRECLSQLRSALPQGASEALERFGCLLEQPGTSPRSLTWEELDALLEGVQRARDGVQPPELLQVNWRQLYGREQLIEAKAMAAGEALAPCFHRPQDSQTDLPDPGAGLGFAVASRLLGLAEGNRRIELKLAFSGESASLESFRASLVPQPGTTLPLGRCAGEPPRGPDQPGWGLNQALLVEATTAEGWWVVPISAASLQPLADAKPAQWEMALTLKLSPSDPALAPLTPGEQPRLRLRLRSWRGAGSAADPWRNCAGFEALRVAGGNLRVEVDGLKGVRLQQDGTPVDPLQPFMPFGSQPELGSSLYISQPELLDGDLEEISFSGTWQKLPTDLAQHYAPYNKLAGTTLTDQSFQIELSLLERNAPPVLGQAQLALFQASGANQDRLMINWTMPTKPRPKPLAKAPDDDDLRGQERVWRWRLTPRTFGHGLYPALAASQAQALALAMSEKAGLQALAMAEATRGTGGSLKQRYEDALKAVGATPIPAAGYPAPEPYTPLLAGLEVGYSRSQDLGASADPTGQLLHVHLFGEEEPLTLPPPPPPGSQAPWQAPPLLPSHPHPGELWLELEGVRPGQPISLAFQVAEGSARGARPPEAIRCDLRRGWLWQALPVREDGTDGLLHSGIVRFALPETRPDQAALPERLWIRASLLAPVESYATILAIQSQAVEAVALRSSGGEPLPPHAITGLEQLQPEIAAIHQPFSSRAGRAAETEAELQLRAAEQLRHKGRALAAWDYERLLWDAFASQLHAVVCLPARRDRGVEVVVIPNLRQQVPRNLFTPGTPLDQLAAMEQHLRERCPSERSPVVRNAVYMPVTVRVWVCLREGVDPAYAERQLRQELIRCLSPWCFNADAEVRLGGEVRAGDLVAAVEALPFVAYLERLRLFLMDHGGKPLRSHEEVLRAPATDVVLIAAATQEIEFVTASASAPPLHGIGSLLIGLDFQVA